MNLVAFSRYYHVQRGPWWLLCYAFAAASLIAGSYLPVPAPKITLWVAGGMLLLLGAAIRHLIVEDEGDRLFVHFGPLPLFRKRIRYEDIRDVENGELPFHEGAGIHWGPWEGWTWSVGGRGCVVLRLKRGTFRVGTDDADGLAGFVKGRIAGAGE